MLRNLKFKRARPAPAVSASTEPVSERPVLLEVIDAAADLLTIDEEAEARRAERESPPIGRFLEMGAVRLHYVDRGVGRPVVYLHGAGGMVQDFASSGLAVAAQRYRTIAIDRPGYGHSTRTRNEQAGLKRQAALIHDALARLGVERPILIGHSWGGALALAYALEFPADIAGLVLLAGWSHPARHATVMLMSLPAAPLIGDLMGRTVLSSFARSMARDVLAKIFAPNPVPASFENFPIGLSIRPSQLRANAEDLRRLNLTVARLQHRYHQITVPVEIVTGDKDQIVDHRQHALRLAAALPQARLTLLPGVGHMVHHVAPEAVLAALDRVAAASTQPTVEAAIDGTPPFFARPAIRAL
ncbi:MAG TPA: alpha/beta hydrolase [Stellaceae bacterium]|nr:alpha/beta hydrolase [Stellaceae bacterium]